MSDKIEQSDYKHGTPPDGWECLATMDEITTADGNYGTSECVRCLIQAQTRDLASTCVKNLVDGNAKNGMFWPYIFIY